MYFVLSMIWHKRIQSWGRDNSHGFSNLYKMPTQDVFTYGKKPVRQFYTVDSIIWVRIKCPIFLLNSFEELILFELSNEVIENYNRSQSLSKPALTFHQRHCRKIRIYIPSTLIKMAPAIIDAWLVREGAGTTQWYISVAKSNGNGWGEGVVGVYHVHKVINIRLILGLGSANEIRRYFLTTFLIGWAQN